MMYFAYLRNVFLFKEIHFIHSFIHSLLRLLSCVYHSTNVKGRTCRGLFSPSNMWVPRNQIRQSGLALSAFIWLSHCPSCQSYYMVSALHRDVTCGSSAMHHMDHTCLSNLAFYHIVTSRRDRVVACGFPLLQHSWVSVSELSRWGFS